MRAVLIAALAATILSGCAVSPETERNIAIGTGVGAGVGAGVGVSIPPGNLAAAGIGAGIGAVTGGVIGALVRPKTCYVRNKNGELWQVPCEDTRDTRQACFEGNILGGPSEVPCRPPRS